MISDVSGILVTHFQGIYNKQTNISLFYKFLENGLQVYTKRRKACHFILNMNIFVTSLTYMCIIKFIKTISYKLLKECL